MALSIGVSVGSKIDIEGHTLEVKDLLPPNLIVISLDKGPHRVVSDQSKIQLLPDVWVFSGVGKNGGSNRLAFEAPRSIRITRIEVSHGN